MKKLYEEYIESKDKEANIQICLNTCPQSKLDHTTYADQSAGLLRPSPTTCHPLVITLVITLVVSLY
jgi:hypothetical protein